MALVSTPADRFEAIPDYDYPVSRVSVGDGTAATPGIPAAPGTPEMASVDVSGDGPETFLCLHGEPTWGYLYRGLIDRLSDRGRVVVPDAIGFGRSDKYTDRDTYTFRLYYDALVEFIERLDLTDITLVCQDWGGALGLTAAANRPQRFARLVPMNTDLPTGEAEMPSEWHRFREFVESTERLDVGRLVSNGTERGLSDAEAAAYDAPFTSEAEKAGAYAWPDLVPRRGGGDGGDLTTAARDRLREWEKPAFVLFSDGDPITRDAREDLRSLLPTATRQPDVWIENAGHYLQEDAPDEIAERIVAFVDRTESPS